jgi:hypothetical protein
VRSPLVSPEGKALEAVDDLEKTAVVCHDPDRQVLQLGQRALRLNAAQPLQARAQQFDRNHGHRRPNMLRRRIDISPCGLHGSAR